MASSCLRGADNFCNSDADTVELIHEQVPDAPVLAKPVFRHTLADAIAAVTKH